MFVEGHIIHVWVSVTMWRLILGVQNQLQKMPFYNNIETSFTQPNLIKSTVHQDLK